MIGKTISHYKILEKLGAGGMDVVFKAENTKLKRTVMLAFLSRSLTVDPEANARFIHEAKAVSAKIFNLSKQDQRIAHYQRYKNIERVAGYCHNQRTFIIMNTKVKMI